MSTSSMPTKVVESRTLGTLVRIGQKSAIAKVKRALRKHDNRIGAAAAELGVAASTLHDWLVHVPELQAAKERTRGRHGARKLTHGNVTLSVSGWCERLGISRTAFYGREARGLEGDALFAPGPGFGNPLRGARTKS